MTTLGPLAAVAEAVLLSRLEFRVQLTDESVRASRDRRNFGIEVRRGMRGDNFFRRLTLFDKLRHTIANSQNHVPVRDYGGSINCGAVAWNNFRIGSRHTDNHGQSIEHSVQAAAIGAIDIGVADRA